MRHCTACAVMRGPDARKSGNWVLFAQSLAMVIRPSLPRNGQDVEQRLRIQVPRRIGSTGDSHASGPKPFSREWVNAPPEVRQPAPTKPTRGYEAPGWLPSPHTVSLALVTVLVLLGALLGGSLTPALTSETDDFVIMQPGTVDPAPTSTSSPEGMVIDGSPTATVTVAVDVGSTGNFPDEPLLPDYRILAFYGHPHTPDLGILGQHGKAELLELLNEEAAGYERADPDTPVMPAFEVIASVAQGEAGADGTWLAQTDEETIRDYIAFTQANDILLILDVQLGRTSIQDEWEFIAPYMTEPNVHLAIDPEFAMGEDQVPGVDIGSIDAEDIAFAQEQLSDVVAENDLPPKVLIVHRFTDGMVTNAGDLDEVDGVQLVVDVDGFGDPASKTESYQLFATDGGFAFAGIKLFYDQDHPLMQPEEVLALDPPPNFVMYQ